MPWPVVLLLAVGVVFFILGFSGSAEQESPEETTPAEKEATETEPVATTPVSQWKPGNVTGTDPENRGIIWEIFENGRSKPSFTREEPISFGAPEDYFALPGIATFRGNNYRNSAAYGTAEITTGQLDILWDHATQQQSGATWSGCGWTGQPLIVQWDAQTLSHTDIYPEKKSKSGLVEVIYAILDGYIYFLDLEDGQPTRDPLYIGQCFKGSGSLDPRGYPLLYVGSGDRNSQGAPRMHIISLIDRTVLFTGGNDDPLSQRTDNDRWSAFDSAPLVDKKTDTLIWPGENGLLYTLRLNTRYDATTGALSIAPDVPVLTRYSTPRTNTETYWPGYEASAAIVENYLYVSENGGLFYCVDLNTMELVWAQDTKDDSNASPVFERVSENEGYIYTAPSLHWTKDSENRGTVSVYKLDALTGDILWETPFQVHTREGVSGGMQSTALLGKPGTDLEGMVILSISRTPDAGSGILVALDTETGQELWRYDMAYYAWSSPTAVYTDGGKGHVILGDSGGRVHLLNSDGQPEDILQLNGLIEASPVIYNDIVILGTRENKIYGIKLS